jgi:hypothetical protein
MTHIVKVVLLWVLGVGIGVGHGGKPSTVAPPTISLVTPNIGPTSGGTSVTITGTNYTGCTGVTFTGAAITSFVVVNSTTITGVSPSFTTTGSSIGSIVTVQCPPGNVSGSTTPTKFFYSLATDTASVVQFNRGDVGTTIATGVSQWNDLTATGNNGVQATGANQPVLTSNFGSTTLPFLRFNGSTARMGMASFAGGFSNLHAAACIVARWPAGVSATTYAAVWDNIAGLAFRVDGAALWSVTDFASAIQASGATNTSAHVFCANATTGTNASTFNVDGTQYTGTISSNLTAQAASIGALNSGGSNAAQVDIEAVVLWNGTISSGDITTAIAGLTATSM